MAVFGKLGEKQYVGKGVLGGLCFSGGAYVPFLPGGNSVCTGPKPESTDVSQQPKPS